jgi:hypothetical protein
LYKLTAMTEITQFPALVAVFYEQKKGILYIYIYIFIQYIVLSYT